jgi:hypothetical protein
MTVYRGRFVASYALNVRVLKLTLSQPIATPAKYTAGGLATAGHPRIREPFLFPDFGGCTTENRFLNPGLMIGETYVPAARMTSPKVGSAWQIPVRERHTPAHVIHLMAVLFIV